MTAYAIFIREITHNQAELDTYIAAPNKGLDGLAVKILAAYGSLEILEGPTPEGVVIAEFPTIEAAKDWYFSDDYQQVVQHRFRGATYRAILVEGV
jgi:uncharacterized protein (DUF1330 family)